MDLFDFVPVGAHVDDRRLCLLLVYFVSVYACYMKLLLIWECCSSFLDCDSGFCNNKFIDMIT